MNDFMPISCESYNKSNDGDNTTQHRVLESLLSDFEPRPFAPTSGSATEGGAKHMFGLEDLDFTNFSEEPFMTNRSTDTVVSATSEPQLDEEEQYFFDEPLISFSLTEQKVPDAQRSQVLIDCQKSVNDHFCDSSSLLHLIAPEPKSPSQQSEKWDNMFQQLLQWRAEHGHCQVRHNDPASSRLASWLKRNKYQVRYDCFFFDTMWSPSLWFSLALHF